ncbi:MAG: mandelate racemase/muconate lactonizing enzyme family protein, partial [Burkholderiales bacterium]
MRIADVRAYPVSYPIAARNRVALGIGTAVKRDAVLVKVSTDDGLVGWGEAHHGRAHTAVAKLIETTLKQLIVGLDSGDISAVWEKMYRYQLASHGMGAGACLAISGIDMALWDIRGKAAGQPLYQLLGGTRKPIPAYAGGVSLGYQEPQALVAEAQPLVAAGYKALKLRVGDTPARDQARVAAVRKALGDDIVILSDANTGYSVADVRQIMPGFDAHAVGWLEEPFPPHDYASYAQAATFGNVPLAAGENHYTRFEFHRMIEDGVITIL